MLHKHGELLYNGVVEAVRHHLAKMADEVRRSADELLLLRLREAWDVHQREMRNVRDILMYMDRCVREAGRCPTRHGAAQRGTFIRPSLLA